MTRSISFSRWPAALTAALVLALTPAAAGAIEQSPLRTQAVALVALDHHAFLAVRAAEPPPFDWSSDGCTSTPPTWATLFDGPCEQHDFGYRNLGHGLRLSPAQSTRRWVDRRLLAELRRVCSERFSGPARLLRCRVRARLMYAAVRIFNPAWG